MDFVVYPGSRIARLPSIARPPALLMRNLFAQTKRLASLLVAKPLFGFVYNSDGLATAHHSPFLNDPQFIAAYDAVSSWWLQGRELDVRWRMWLMTQCAAQCAKLPGSFVEFGTYRAGCAFVILTLCDLDPGTKFYLFDTFQGIPVTNLTSSERKKHFAGRKADTSIDHVEQVLRDWREQIAIVAGDVFETLNQTETGSVAFCHLDLNASAPSLRALEYLYPRLLPSAMIVMDDYGQRAFAEQRAVIDAFFQDKPEVPMALPTGQGLVVKLA